MLEERASFPVKLMARMLEVSRSGFYSWLSAGRPQDGWAAERDAVMRVWLESDRRFGFRSVHAMLPREFSHLTRYRVLKLMRELGIRGCTPNAVSVNIFFTISTNIFSPIAPPLFRRPRQRGCAASG